MTMQRVRSHVLEDKSLNILGPMLGNWIVHSFRRDYGIDVQLELFADSGMAMGLRCYGQLKATDSAKDEDELSLNRDHFEYWSSHTDPVLLLRYYEEDQSFHWCWMHEVAWSMNPRKKSLSVASFLKPWSKEKTKNEISDFLAERARVIASSLLPPFKIAIINSALNAKDISALTASMAHHVSGRLFDVLTGDRPDAAFKVIIKNKKIVTTHLGLPGFTVSLKDVQCDKDAVVWLLIFLTACRYDRILAARPLAQQHTPLLVRGAPGQLQANLIDAMAYALGITDAVTRLTPFVDATSGGAGIDRWLLTSLLFRAAHRFGQVEEWTDFLRDSIAASVNIAQKAVDSYNLGNAFAVLGRWREAATALQAAAQWDENYLQRAYFRRELGVALFECGNYDDSIIQCQEALKLEDDVRTRYLMGDALFRAGNFSFARDEVRKSMEGGLGAECHAHALLLIALCDDMVDKWQLDKLTDAVQYKGEVAELKKLRALDEPEFNQRLVALLARYGTSGDFSFNSGHALFEAKRYRCGALRYLHCACLKPSDAEAWAWGIEGARRSNDAWLATLGVSVGYSSCGEVLLNMYLQKFEPRGVSAVEIQRWRSDTESLFRKAQPAPRSSLTLRLWSSDGMHNLAIPG